MQRSNQASQTELQIVRQSGFHLEPRFFLLTGLRVCFRREISTRNYNLGYREDGPGCINPIHPGQSPQGSHRESRVDLPRDVQQQ